MTIVNIRTITTMGMTKIMIMTHDEHDHDHRAGDAGETLIASDDTAATSAAVARAAAEPARATAHDEER